MLGRPSRRRSSRLSPCAAAGGRCARDGGGSRALGLAGNWVAAIIRGRAGHRLSSPALIADGAHARADAYASLAVVAGAGAVAAGSRFADPMIGLGITLVIPRITWDSWQTVRASRTH